MTHPQRAAQAKHDNPQDIFSEVLEALRVRLLGSFRVSVGSRTLGESGWRLRKARSLVKLLALAPDHRMHREQVMEWLWPDLDTEAATNNLRQALHVARRLLEPGTATASCYLQLRGDQLVLCPDRPLWVDVEAFEEAAATARHTLEPAAYRAALDLYAGDLLPGNRYERWAEDRREELRRLYLALLLELAGLCEKRDDFGPGIEALGGVVASEPTHEEAHVGLMRLYAASGRRHEAILQYERLRDALSEELGDEPGEAGRYLYEQIRAGQSQAARLPAGDRAPGAPPQPPLHNLPVARTSFIGREDEVLEVKRLLAMTRLLTLTGTGGCGKTRLALAVAGDLVGAYPDRVWLVELAALSDPALVLRAVAAALGVREQPNRSLTATLGDFLSARNLLLVLDNCEHLVDAVARLVGTLLDSCPGLRVMATSREALSVAGELIWRVSSLTVPDPGGPPAVEDLARSESARLFVERARYRRPAFVPTPENAGIVAEICRQLEGIPLAMELAAARVGVLSVEQIAARLKDSLKLLAGGDRMAPPRQRTLRGTLDWSYDLLSEPERKLFGRLSVFAGGWTLEAAEAVGKGEGIEGDDVLDLISRLVDKSMVVVEATGEEDVRYRLLEPVRQYGLERLEESGEADTVRRRHATWFLELAEGAEPELRGQRQEAWLKRLEIKHDNLRTALQWALEREEAELGPRLSGALGEFWHMRGHLSEGRRWLEAALAKGDVAPARAKALARAGYVAWEQGYYERSVALSEESLALSRKLGDEADAATALYALGWAAMFGNELERASVLTEEAVTLQRALNDTAGVARSLLILGFVANSRRDYERAMALYEESLALAREAGDGFAIVLSLGVGALAALGGGDHRRARALCEEGLELSRQLKTMHLTAVYLHVAASLAGSQGRAVRSARLWGAAESLREATGAIFSPFERHLYGPYIATARARLDEAPWEAAWAEGKAMSPEEAAEYALSEEEPRTTAPTPEKPPVGRKPTELTRREREVAVLVARGLTNRRIASELVISEHTVITHVRKILKKLGLHSRTQLAAWIMEQGLLP